MPARTIAPSTNDISFNADAFTRSLEYEGKSPKTIASYAEATRQLAAYLAAAGMPLVVASLTREHIESFLLYLRNRGLSDSTRTNRYRSLQ